MVSVVDQTPNTAKAINGIFIKNSDETEYLEHLMKPTEESISNLNDKLQFENVNAHKKKLLLLSLLGDDAVKLEQAELAAALLRRLITSDCDQNEKQIDVAELVQNSIGKENILKIILGKPEVGSHSEIKAKLLEEAKRTESEKLLYQEVFWTGIIPCAVINAVSSGWLAHKYTTSPSIGEEEFKILSSIFLLNSGIFMSSKMNSTKFGFYDWISCWLVTACTTRIFCTLEKETCCSKVCFIAGGVLSGCSINYLCKLAYNFFCKKEHEPKVTVNDDEKSNSTDIPTTLTRKKGGDKVAVPGDFNQWENKCKITNVHKQDDVFDGVETIGDRQPTVKLDGHGQVNVLVI